MRKQKQFFAWPLSVLVVAVSFLSVLVVLRQVEAVWLEPNYLPQDTSLNTFVFNPLIQPLDLGGENITGNGNISIVGNITATNGNFTGLTVNGVPVSGGGGGTGSADWAINYSASRALYYTTTSPASNGNVGIGTTTPVTKLHINDSSSGPIITLSGLNTNYKGLTIKNEVGTEQWFAGSNTSNNYIVRRNGVTDYFNINANTGDVNVTQNLAVGGNLTVTGTINGSGGGASAASDWLINRSASNALYYTTTTASGYVGIGTNTPNKLLHLYSTSPNAELDIQSVAGAGNHWAMYHDSSSNDLRFWKGGADRITFADTGEVGINTIPNTSNQLTVSGATKNGIYSSITGNNTAAVHGYSSFSGTYPNNSYAVRAEASETFFTGGTGLYATGNYGVKTVGSLYGLWASVTSQSGKAIYAEGISNGSEPLHVKANGAVNGAALFEGNVTISGGILGVSGNITSGGLIKPLGPNSFIFVTSGNGAPTLSCTDTTNRGATYFDYSSFKFYICSGTTGWKSTTLN